MFCGSIKQFRCNSNNNVNAMDLIDKQTKSMSHKHNMYQRNKLKHLIWLRFMHDCLTEIFKNKLILPRTINSIQRVFGFVYAQLVFCVCHYFKSEIREQTKSFKCEWNINLSQQGESQWPIKLCTLPQQWKYLLDVVIVARTHYLLYTIFIPVCVGL